MVKLGQRVIAVDEHLTQAGVVILEPTNHSFFKAQLNPARGNLLDPVVGCFGQVGQAVLDRAVHVGELLHRPVFVGV